MFVLMVCFAPMLLGQTESLVEVPVTISDKAGNVLNELGKSELSVTVDGKPVSVVSVEKETLPLLYVIAVDNSGSMRQQLGEIVATAKALVAMNSDSERAALMRFVGRKQIQMTGTFTTDQQKLNRVADNFYVEGGQTVIIDPIFMSAKVFAAMPTGGDFAKGVVVISDGEDRDSEAKLEQVFELTQKHKVRVYFIGLFEELQSASRGDAKKLILNLTTSTGGYAVFPKKKGNLPEAAKAIGTALRSRLIVKFLVPVESKRGSRIEMRLAKESTRKDLNFSYNPVY